MKDKTRIGAAIAIVGALLGIILVYTSFLQVYEPIMASEMSEGRTGGEGISEGISVSKYVMPVVNDIVLIGGVLWAVAAYGFINKEDWAWATAVTANVISLFSFFMLIPAMSRGISPIYIAVFIPNIIAFFILILYIKRIDWKIAIISTVAGMTYVMSFMNGVAATDQMLSGGNLVFIIGQRLSWIAALGWGIFVVALLTRRKWALPLGMGTALLTLIAGIPPGIVISMQASKFSMYLFAPILALALKVVLVVPKSNEVLATWVSTE